MKDTIKINGLEKALDKIQKNSKVRTLSCEDVFKKLEALQKELNIRLFKKDQVGLQVRITVYTKVASCYQGMPQATFVTLEKGRTVWKLVDVERSNGIPANAEVLNIDKFQEQVMAKVISDLSRMYVEIED